MLLINTIINTLRSISRDAEDHFCKAYAEFELKEIKDREYVDPSDSLNKFFEKELGSESLSAIHDYLDHAVELKSPTWQWEYIAKEYAAQLFPTESKVRKLFAIFDGFNNKHKFEFLEQYQTALNEVLVRCKHDEVNKDDNYLSINFDGDSADRLLDIITNTPGIIVINCCPPPPKPASLMSMDLRPISYSQSLVNLLHTLMLIPPASMRAKAIIFSGEHNRMPEKLSFMVTAIFATSLGPVQNLREMTDAGWQQKILDYGTDPRTELLREKTIPEWEQ
jgi:hypothetical protein